ncbi:hypothetical protein DAKH74_006800 [Maudiozyma humilis]|uniref:VASt domain-containing protein n=1 Tax=Maudiozyma humilis TaxID=51915 RepID=A0AAV5RU42_MAUHU|nr:hypothetical protein DAKH74_006800 [Kazachstania humilis]
MTTDSSKKHHSPKRGLLASLGLRKRKSSKSMKSGPSSPHSNSMAHSHSTPAGSASAGGKQPDLYADIPVMDFSIHPGKHGKGNRGTHAGTAAGGRRRSQTETAGTGSGMHSRARSPARGYAASATHSYSSGMSASDRVSQLHGFYNLPIVVGAAQGSTHGAQGARDTASLASYAHSRFSLSEPNLSRQNTNGNGNGGSPQPLPLPGSPGSSSGMARIATSPALGTSGSLLQAGNTSGHERTIHDQTMANAKQLLQTFDTLLQQGGKGSSASAEAVVPLAQPQPVAAQPSAVTFATPELRVTAEGSEVPAASAAKPRASADIRRISLDSLRERESEKENSAPVTRNHAATVGGTANRCIMGDALNVSSQASTSTPRRSFSPLNVRDFPSNALKMSINTAKAGTSLVTGPLRQRGSSFFSASPVSSRVNTSVLDTESENEGTQLPMHPQWTGVTYAPENRNADFHRLFKRANSAERLISEHNTTLFKDMMLQGKLYVADCNLYFYSNILGYVTTYVIPYCDIISIEKKTVAGLFPNAIGVDTENTKYVFASLSSRENTLATIRNVWHQASNHRRKTDDLIAPVEPMISESGDEDEDDYSEGDEGDDDNVYETDITSELSMGSAQSLHEAKQLVQTGTVTVSSSSKGSTPPAAATTTTTSGVNGIPTLGLKKHDPTTPGYTPVPTDKKIYDSTINAPLGTVVNVLFGEDTQYLEDMLKEQGNFEFSKIPSDLIASKSRDYSYTKPLSGSIGPSKTKCLVTEVIDNYDLDGYVQVTQTTKNPDVPSGNAFVSCTTFVLSWDADNSTRMTVYVRVDWSGKSWIKSAIEKGTIDGVTSATKSLADAISKLVVPKEATPTKSRRGTTSATKGGSSLPNIQPYTHAPTVADIKNENGDKIIKENRIIECSLGTTFQLLFGNNSSYLRNILTKQNNIDISEIPKFEDKKRVYIYVKLLNNSLGPKQTKCIITETIEHMDMQKYILVRQVSQTPDVPSGSSFTVQTRFYLSWGPSNTTNLTVITNIAWTGRSFIKGAIEKGSVDGQKVSVDIMLEELGDVIEKAKLGSKSGKRKKSRTTSRRQTKSSVGTTPKETTPEPTSSGILGSFSRVFSLFTDPLLRDFDPTSPKTLGSLFVCVLMVFTFFRMIIGSKSNTPKISLLKGGRILIDDSIYNYVPAFDTLKEPYYGGSSNHTPLDQSHKEIIDESEDNIWEWMKSRGNPSSIHRMPNYYDEPDVKNTKLEELLETIKIANIQLEEMKKRAAELEL